MTALFDNIKSGWQTYTALLLIAGSVAAFASLPGRLDALEARVSTLERVARYQGCRFYFQDTGRDPGGCAVIYRDLEDYLTSPNAAKP